MIEDIDKIVDQFSNFVGEKFKANDDDVGLVYQAETNFDFWALDVVDPLAMEDFLRSVEVTRNRVIQQLGCRSQITMSITCITLLKFFQQEKDLRFLNTVIKILWRLQESKFDTVSNLDTESLIESVTLLFESRAGKTRPLFDASKTRFTERLISDPIASWTSLECPEARNTSVVVFCPNPYSSATLAALELLNRKDFQIKAVVVKKILNFSRFKKEFKRDGSRLIRKIYRKLVLNDAVRVDASGRNLSDTLSELNIKKESVYSWSRRHGVEVISCGDINDQKVVSKLSNLEYDYGIFTGGGILSNNVLETARRGILNCHAGLLPYYRGMDVIEWPVLLCERNNIGSTVHFMTDEVDSGGILLGYRIEKDFDVLSARYELESYWQYLLVIALMSHVNKPELEFQAKSDGKHFYVLHKTLFDLAVHISNTTIGGNAR